jgi:glycosyltransferase involved in cell wall biosynthesis
MNKLKVAIDSGPLTGGHSFRGIGFHTKLLIEHLKNNPNLSLDVIDFKKNTKFLKKEKFDVLHYPSFHPYFISLPFVKYSKVVVTIHDLIPLIYPNKFPGGIKGKLKFFIQKQLIKRVDAIITISETSKKDICRFLGVKPQKVFVTHLSAREKFKPITGKTLSNIQKKYNLPNKFVLYVGDVNYNKNIVRLADACKMADLKLVIVGKQAANNDFDRNHIENEQLKELIAKYGNDKDILRIGFIEDDDLNAIYSLARVYCQPSLYEGFGLPVVEAFSCGLPVVAAKNNCLVEVADGAALFVDPTDVKDISQKLLEVSEDEELRKDLIEKGFERSKNFSWEKTATKTFEVYKKVAQKS